MVGFHAGFKLKIAEEGLFKKFINPSTHQFSTEWFVWEEWHFLLVILDGMIITHCRFSRCIFMVFSLIPFKPQKVSGLIVNLPLYQFPASCHAQFTLWA